jgi:predicted transcriptional regulator
MKLSDYLLKHRIAAIDFAVKNRIGLTSLYRYLKGQRPLKKIAFKLERITNGEVSAEELLAGKPTPPKKPKKE